MILLLVSDFHLGKGQYFKNGQLNIMEDFTEDERFLEFLDYYSSGKYYLMPVHLVLNGDIFNLIEIDIDGVYTHIMDDQFTVAAIKAIQNGHKKFFESLKLFSGRPNKNITYVIGNHDSGMAFKKAQDYLNQELGGKIEFCFEKIIHGVHIEHGQRYETVNSVPMADYFQNGPNGKVILNLPWASLFCVMVIPKLKKERPYIDRIRPMSAYVIWCLFHDFPFFLKMFREILDHLYKTRLSAFTKFNKNIKTSLRIIKQITIYPRYAKFAKMILNRNKDIHTVVMGHVHLSEWRKFPEGKYYFNSGTWNAIPSVDLAQHQHMVKLSYILIDINPKNNVLKKASLNTWQGKWRPYRQEASSN